MFCPTMYDYPFSQSCDYGMAAWCRGSPGAAQDSPADFLLPSPPLWSSPRFPRSPPPREAQPSSLGREAKTEMSGEAGVTGLSEECRIKALPSCSGWFKLAHPPTPAPSFKSPPCGEFLNRPTSDSGVVHRLHRLSAQGCLPLDTGEMNTVTRTRSQAEMWTD